jgi:hypothetical protein
MNLLRRVTVAVLAGSLVAAAPAAAESVKVQVTPDTFLYAQGDQGTMSGEIGMCVQGKYFGGSGPAPPKGYDGDPCPARTGDTTLPPEGGGGGGGTPAPPCTDAASCQAFFAGLLGGGGGGDTPAPPCTDEASCQAFFEGLLGGGGGDAPAPPCTDQASCETFFGGLVGGGGGGGGGAPTTRDCTSLGGGAATCVDFGDGNFILGDAPDDGYGEFGFCTSSDQAPAGPGYYYVSGPPPGGDAAAPCPTAAPAAAPPAEGGGGDTGSGDGGSTDSGSTDSGSTDSGSTAEGGTTESGSTTTTQQRQSEPAELPSIDVTRNRLRVSRRGWVAIPLACLTTRTPCVGELRLTATRRTRTGKRVRVLLAKAVLHVDAGDSVKRRVRLTKAGRRLLAKRGKLGARARTVLTHSGGSVVRSERVVLRRA